MFIAGNDELDGISTPSTDCDAAIDWRVCQRATADQLKEVNSERNAYLDVPVRQEANICPGVALNLRCAIYSANFSTENTVDIWMIYGWGEIDK